MNRPNASTPRHHRHRQRRRNRRRRQIIGTRMIKVLPSAFTLANLLAGFAAIFYASRLPGAERLLPDISPLTLAASLIFLGMIFDALDGRVARITRQTSELGEQLDSMADMVTFGVAPAFLLIQLADIGAPFFGHERFGIFYDRVVLAVAAVYVACCALRLARFNIELGLPGESRHLSFKGLPSPAAAGTVAALILLHESLRASFTETLQILDDSVTFEAANVVALAMVLIVLLTAVAMVSTMRYTHLLNRYVRGRAPFAYLAYAVLLLVPLLIWPQLTLAIGFTGYAVATPARLAYQKLRKKAPSPQPASPRDEADAASDAEPPTPVTDQNA